MPRPIFGPFNTHAMSLDHRPAMSSSGSIRNQPDKRCMQSTFGRIKQTCSIRKTRCHFAHRWLGPKWVVGQFCFQNPSDVDGTVGRRILHSVRQVRAQWQMIMFHFPFLDHCLLPCEFRSVVTDPGVCGPQSPAISDPTFWAFQVLTKETSKPSAA